MTLLFGTLFMAMLGIMGGSLDIDGGSTFGIALGFLLLAVAEWSIAASAEEPQ